MSGSRLIDELTCCLNQSTTTLQYCVEAEENWRNRALLHAARERHLDSVASAVESARQGRWISDSFNAAESPDAIALQVPLHERRARE